MSGLEPRSLWATRHTEKHGLSLISFHRILIAAAILFCAGYSAYELSSFTKDGGDGSVLISGVFFVLAAGLSYYLWHLKRFLGIQK